MSTPKAPPYDELKRRLEAAESALTAIRERREDADAGEGEAPAARKLEEDLRKEREISKRLIEDGPVGIVKVNRGGEIVFANRHAEELLGLEISDIEGRTYNAPDWRITAVDGAPFPDEELPFRRVMATGRAVADIQHAIVGGDGSQRILSINGAPLHDAQGQIEGVVLVILDITEHHAADEALKQALNFSRTLLDSIPTPVFYKDKEGRYQGCNRAFSAVMGVTAEEIRGKTAHELWPGEYSETYHTADLDLMENPEHQVYEFEVKDLNKNVRPVVFAKDVFRDGKGSVAGIVGAFLDISEQKQAEQIIIKQRERLNSILEGTKAGTWEWNVQTGETIFNEEWARIIGYTLEEISPVSIETWIQYAHPEDLEESNRLLRSHFKKETDRYHYECRMKHKSGEWVWVLDRGKVATWTEDGKPEWMYGTHQDITERKAAEETLRESEKRFATAFQHSPAPLVLSDIDTGRFIDVNQRWVEMLEFTREEQIGRTSKEVGIWDDPDERDRIVGILRSDGHFRDEFIKFKTKSGNTILALWSAETVDLSGKQIMLSMITDITQLRQAEEERERLGAQLQQAQKLESVGRLAGGVAHDFNNMLSVVIGHADLILAEMTPDSPFYDDLMEIRNAGARSADLTRKLLAFARKQTVAPKVIDLNKTVEGMLKMLQRLIGEDIDITWLPGVKVWPAKIDPGQIDQMLANLCVNARDAIAGVGKLTIEAANARVDKDYCADHAEVIPGDYVMLAVSDNGCGMDAETLSHLFEPFFTTKELGKGTGLGLATVYGVVKQNNGFINVYSEPGRGTTFRIYLPRHQAKAAAVLEKKPEKPNERGHETVLLVEDEPSILRMTALMLERQGYTVVGASTPGEAVRLATAHAGVIHLLMTDVVMPEMNGRDLAKNILSLYPGMKCLFMSGYTANVIAHHGVLDEGVNFIQKPFSIGDLAVKVREALES
jgi:PAS domain S-box-containing protein